jgi:hypothetical protein
MLETVICVCGALLLGGIARICSSDSYYSADYSEEYYRHLRGDKKSSKLTDVEFYRFL